jgi:hypothetical protein
VGIAAIAQVILRISCGEYFSLLGRAGIAINDRQRLVLNRLLDGFEGKLTTSK